MEAQRCLGAKKNFPRKNSLYFTARYKAWSEEGELLCPAMNQHQGVLDKTREDLIQETKTWDEALDYCIERNTSLASMNSSTIMDLAVNMAKNAQTVNVWTGLRFLNHWFWVNGGDLEYKAWSEEGEIHFCFTKLLHNPLHQIRVKPWLQKFP
ncbi:hypothetical protein cypCar_00041911 [Cyprinus carpio]|nr:hypothetical protein cypCar_00041911 [Cyprinus carpio]